MTADLNIEFRLFGACYVTDSTDECISIPIFRRQGSNYSYVAETDIEFKIVRFRTFSQRDLCFSPTSSERILKVGDQCPVLIAERHGNVSILETPISERDIDHQFENRSSPLLRSQLIQISNASFSKSINELEHLVKSLGLNDRQERDLLTSLISGFQSKQHVWKSMLDSKSPNIDELDDYKTWTNDELAV